MIRPNEVDVRIDVTVATASGAAEGSDAVTQTSEVGAPGFEPGTFWSQTRRATGLRYAPL